MSRRGPKLKQCIVAASCTLFLSLHCVYAQLKSLLSLSTCKKYHVHETSESQHQQLTSILGAPPSGMALSSLPCQCTQPTCAKLRARSGRRGAGTTTACRPRKAAHANSCCNASLLRAASSGSSASVSIHALVLPTICMGKGCGHKRSTLVSLNGMIRCNTRRGPMIGQRYEGGLQV